MLTSSLLSRGKDEGSQKKRQRPQNTGTTALIVTPLGSNEYITLSPSVRNVFPYAIGTAGSTHRFYFLAVKVEVTIGMAYTIALITNGIGIA